MVPYYGDFPTSHTAVTIPFATFAASTGAPTATTNFAAADVVIYKNGGTTQRTSSNGITVTTSFDSATGMQMIVIDLSDNTDAGFYAAGNEYQVQVGPITADGQTLTFWAGCFAIERAGGVLALLKAGTAKVDVTKWLTGTIPAVTTTGVPLVDTKYVTGTLQTARDIGASVLLSSGTGTGQLKLASGYVAMTWADVAAPTTTLDLSGTTIKTSQVVASVTGAVGSVTGAVGSVTGNVGGNVTGSVGSVVGAVGSVTGNIGGNLGGTLTTTERDAIADATLNRDMSTGTDSGSTTVRTMRQALRFLRNKWSISGTTLTVTKEDDATSSWTSTVTTTSGADPVTANDPAGP